jgi:hypothetical protein
MSRPFSLAMAFTACGSALFLAACGTSATSPTPSDASTSDAANGSNDGASTSDAGEAGIGEDAATDAPDPKVCWAESADSCLGCCANFYPVGYGKFGTIELGCACAPTLCGPLDGGTGAETEGGAPDAASDEGGALDGSASEAGTAGDAGPFGTGACAATCTAPSSPEDTCITCIRATLGSTSALGPCGSTVLGGCLTDLQCNLYLSCIESCPN